MASNENDFNTATGNLLEFLNKELPNDFNEKYFEIQNIAKSLRKEIWPTQDDENIDADFKSYILSDNGKDDLELYIELINNLYKQRGVVLDGTSGNTLSQGYLLGLMPDYKQFLAGVNLVNDTSKMAGCYTNEINRGHEYYKNRGFSDKEANLLEQRDKYRELIGDRFAYKADIDPEGWLDNEIKKLEQDGYHFSEVWKKHIEIEKNIVEKGNQWALEVSKMEGKIPCASVVYDPLLNEYYFTKNYKTNKKERGEYEEWAYGNDSKSAIHPILKERLNMYEADINSGKVTLPGKNPC